MTQQRMNQVRLEKLRDTIEGLGQPHRMAILELLHSHASEVTLQENKKVGTIINLSILPDTILDALVSRVAYILSLETELQKGEKMKGNLMKQLREEGDIR